MIILSKKRGTGYFFWMIEEGTEKREKKRTVPIETLGEGYMVKKP